MLLYLTARRIQLTEALHDHVERHLRDAIEGRTNLRTTRMEVQLYRISGRDLRYGCHVLLELSRRQSVNIREEDRDLYAAIDVAQKRLVRAVTEVRDRQVTEGRHTRRYGFNRLVASREGRGRPSPP